MKCPICQSECLPIHGQTIGRLPGRPDLDLKTVIGFNCPIRTNLPAGAKTPHYTVRGQNETVTLFPYRVTSWYEDFSIWEPDRSKGSSSIYHYTQEAQRFTEVTITPVIKWDTEEKMRNKLAIYILFS